MRKQKIFKISFNFFEPGTKVTPTSHRSELEHGKVYTIIESHDPLRYGDDATCFVEGERYGVGTCYLREVT